MLTVYGGFDEDEVIARCREYIRMYAYGGKTEVAIPFKNAASGRVCYVDFMLVGSDWISLGVRDGK